MGKIDSIIDEFDLDKKLNKKKVGDYFKNFQNKVFNHLNEKLKEEKQIGNKFNNVMNESQDLEKQFHLDYNQ